MSPMPRRGSDVVAHGDLDGAREARCISGRPQAGRVHALPKEPLRLDDSMVWPGSAGGPAPGDDMPDAVRAVFEEARQISSSSPRAAAALLRLSIELLCRVLRCAGTLDQMIDELVDR